MTSNGRPSALESPCTTCSTGSPLASWRRSIRSRRSQPEDDAGQRGDDDLVDPAVARSRPSTALNGSWSPTSPVPSMPSSLHERQRQVDAHLRGVAHRLVVDHVAVARAGAAARRRGSARRPCAARSRIVSSSCAPPIVSLARTRYVRHDYALRLSLGSAAGHRRGWSRLLGPRLEDAVHRARARRTRRGRRPPSARASKLKIGGGEETCHSSVSARHGLAAARGPPRHEATML